MPFISNEDNRMMPSTLKRTDEEQPGAEMPKTFTQEDFDTQAEPIEVNAYGTAVWIDDLMV